MIFAACCTGTVEQASALADSDEELKHVGLGLFSIVSTIVFTAIGLVNLGADFSTGIELIDAARQHEDALSDAAASSVAGAQTAGSDINSNLATYGYLLIASAAASYFLADIPMVIFKWLAKKHPERAQSHMDDEEAKAMALWEIKYEKDHPIKSFS